MSLSKYRPRLGGLINSFEVNYMLLIRLLGHLDEVGEFHHFLINEHLQYQLTIKEKSKYTHLVEFKQLTDEDTDGAEKASLLKKPCMVIRLYHDARLAEVITTQHIRQIKPRYDYPNEAMHQPDEKRQNHQFLTQWLQLCLAQGQSTGILPKKP